MTTVEVTVRLPEELVRDAAGFNIITDATITALLRQELDRRVNDFINTEIHAHRAEKRMPPANEDA